MRSASLQYTMPRLVRMKFQTDLRHPFGDGLQHMLCLGLARTVNHRIIRIRSKLTSGNSLASHVSNA